MATTTRTVDERAQDFYNWNRTEVDTSKVIVPVPDSILGECPQFRILLLGRAGVGKSTVSKLVFGLTDQEAGVRDGSDGGRGIHDVNIPKTSISNERIIIHDSGGFEGGESENFTNVMDFIKRKKLEQRLSQQLHCIWYCISCKRDSRRVQECDRYFFSNLKDIAGPIPVIVVFTQFDILAKEVRDDYIGRNLERMIAGELTREAQQNEVHDEIKKQYHNMRNIWGRVIPSIQVGVVSLSNPSDEILRLNPTLRDFCGELGVNELTRMTMSHLEDHGGLRTLWAAAQNNLADFKLQESIAAGMESFSAHLGVNAIPILPGLSAASFWFAFSKSCSNIIPLWSLKDDKVLLQKNGIRRKLLGAIFNTNPVGFLALQAIDILGFTDAPATAAVFAKTIAGITLILDDLFVLQMQSRRLKNRVTSLTETEINSSIQVFREGKLRENMIKIIDGSSLFTKAYSKGQMANLIYEAVDIARSCSPRVGLDK